LKNSDGKRGKKKKIEKTKIIGKEESFVILVKNSRRGMPSLVGTKIKIFTGKRSKKPRIVRTVVDRDQISEGKKLSGRVVKNGGRPLTSHLAVFFTSR